MENTILRKAKVADAENIKNLINEWADNGKMLHRSIAEIYSNIQSFYVIEYEGRIVGCCSLRIYFPGMGELVSLAVEKKSTRKGLGTMLTKTVIEEARKLGLEEVFTFTYVPEFFERLGFVRMDKNKLHPKIWLDCHNCPKYPDCDETAMMLKI
jgi:amino-acid N-acetyltransferase